MQINSVILVASVGALLLAPAYGVCQDPSAQAKAEFDSGVVLYKAGSFAEAANAFRRANALKPTWSLLFNIAQSEAAAKNYGIAYEAFEEYLAKGGDELTDERRHLVIGELDNLKNFIGSLEISGPPGVTVMVDGLNRGTTPLPGLLKIAIGEIHSVEVRQDGDLLLSEKVKVSQGETVRLDVVKPQPPPKGDDAQPGSTEAPSRGASKAESTRASKLRRLGWSGIGVGASLLVAAAVTGGIALSINHGLDGACHENVCPTDKEKDKETKDALAISSDVLMIVGAVATGAGIGVLAWSLRSQKKNETQQTVSIAPIFGGSSAAIAISGRF